MWYVRDLIILSLLSPVIHILLSGRLYYLFLSIIAIVFSFNIQQDFLQALLYFSVGAYLSIRRKTLYWPQYRCLIILVCLVGFLLRLTMIVDFNFYKVPFTLAYCALVILFTYENMYRLGFEKIKYMGNASFFIYSLHQVLIVDVFRLVILPHVFGQSQSSFILMIEYFLTPILTIAICYMIYIINWKAAPSLFFTQWLQGKGMIRNLMTNNSI